MIEVKAQLRNLRMSPKKVRLVAHALKGLPAHDAAVRLRFEAKIAARPLAKLLASAVANAIHNNNLKKEALFVKNIIVEEGIALRRWKPAAFGSAHSFKKRASHVKLTLGVHSDEAQKSKTKGNESEAVVKKPSSIVKKIEKKASSAKKGPEKKTVTKKSE